MLPILAERHLVCGPAAEVLDVALASAPRLVRAVHVFHGVRQQLAQLPSGAVKIWVRVSTNVRDA